VVILTTAVCRRQSSLSMQSPGMGCGSSLDRVRSQSFDNLGARGVIDKSCFLFSNLIGEGGFGKVFSAMLTESRNWFAVKEINKFELMKVRSCFVFVFVWFMWYMML
jgi:hypothetical protein